MTELMTCSDSLLDPGRCCWPHCGDRATLAVLTERQSDAQMIEHTRCPVHVGGNLAVKPLVWDPIWGPPGSVS